MSKEQKVNPTTGPGHPDNALLNEEHVLTPGGWRPKSKVHLIEAGHHVSGEAGRLRIINTFTKEIVRDFGEIPKKGGKEPNMPGSVYVPELKKVLTPFGSLVPAYGTGWITFAGWTNSSGHPISSFSTSWVVPPPPATSSGQTIFIFNGIQNSGFILQPVLQWGSSFAGGGDYWAIANWYVDGQGGLALHSPLVRVNSGDSLHGLMSLTSQTGNLYSYVSSFVGYPSTSLTIANIEQLTWANETLEAYGITKCSDYPSTTKTAMTSIELKVDNVEATINWQPVNAATECNQHCVVVSNSSPDGEVDIFYNMGTV